MDIEATSFKEKTIDAPQSEPEKNKADQNWLSLVDYAVKNNISLSTIRRYIKANKVIYKKDQGRYLLLDNSHASYENSLEDKIEVLELRLNEAFEQINELKMLLAIYEERLIEN